MINNHLESKARRTKNKHKKLKMNGRSTIRITIRTTIVYTQVPNKKKFGKNNPNTKTLPSATKIFWNSTQNMYTIQNLAKEL